MGLYTKSLILLILVSIGIPTGLILLWVYDILPYEAIMGITTFLMLGIIAFAVKFLPTISPASKSRLELLILSGDYDQAIEILTNKLGKKKKNKKALLNLGGVYFSKGDYEKGHEILNRLLELRPDDPVALYCISTGYRDQGKYKEAIEILIPLAIDGSRSLPKRDYELWFEIAQIYRQKGDLQKALESIDKSLEIRYLFRDAIKFREEIQAELDNR